jgi:D-cysteine desulfhydrase family pyridoxal phosphate-dependent enzyme
LTPLADLLLEPNMPQVWIKRDDLSGMDMSGNKVRKLEFILAEAKQQSSSIVTIGGIQSNHTRATTIAARSLGLDAHIILRTSSALLDKDPGLTGNLLIERLVGAHIYLVSKEEYAQHGGQKLGERLTSRLTEQGVQPAPYFIPVGGSSPLGCWGYIHCIEEMCEQIKSQGLEPFTDIIVACGSGGTAAGLALGNYLSGLNAKVHAYGVCDSPSYFEAYINSLLQGLGAGPDVLQGKTAADLLTFHQAKGLGYALTREDEMKMLADVALKTGIILDPVYTGKAWYGFMRDVVENADKWRGRRVVFVHTGGLFGLYDKVPELQPYVEELNRVQVLGGGE